MVYHNTLVRYYWVLLVLVLYNLQMMIHWKSNILFFFQHILYIKTKTKCHTYWNQCSIDCYYNKWFISYYRLYILSYLYHLITMAYNVTLWPLASTYTLLMSYLRFLFFDILFNSIYYMNYDNLNLNRVNFLISDNHQCLRVMLT